MKPEKVMLAQAGDETKLDEMIASKNWHFEVKYDGERGMLMVSDGTAVLCNRKGKDINSQFPEIEAMGSKLPSGVYDGEIYVQINASYKDKPTTSGRTSVKPTEARILAKVKPATFMCFDVLEYEGENVEGKPYEKRKEILARVDNLRIPGFQGVFPEENPKEAWQQIVLSGNEGMVAKRVGSRYEHLRSFNWLKLKTWKEEDFEVVGITSEKRDISALILNNGMKVNCSLDSEAYSRLLTDLVKTDTVLHANDGSLGFRLKKTYKAKVKYLHKSNDGLRFPILRDLEI